jgi:hypothetical protein
MARGGYDQKKKKKKKEEGRIGLKLVEQFSWTRENESL